MNFYCWHFWKKNYLFVERSKSIAGEKWGIEFYQNSFCLNEWCFKGFQRGKQTAGIILFNLAFQFKKCPVLVALKLLKCSFHVLVMHVHLFCIFFGVCPWTLKFLIFALCRWCKYLSIFDGWWQMRLSCWVGIFWRYPKLK